MPVMVREYLNKNPDAYRIFTRFETADSTPDRQLRTIEAYKTKQGYDALEKIFTQNIQQASIINTIKESGLRGRGGAGFSAGLKWGFVPKEAGDKYLIANFDEGEPGTFKDRYIAELNPHMLIEGIIIAAYAIGAQKSYIYIRGEFQEEGRFLEKAIKEAYQAKYLGTNICGSQFTHNMDIYYGAGAYICGEETGLISSLEGGKGQPKLKPPFPALKGYLNKPTVVNNVETLAAVPWIMMNGTDAYRTFGTQKSPGTKLFNLSGAINNPGCYELPMGYPLKRFIEEEGGGILGGKKLKAVIPGGASAPVLTASEIEGLTLDYESLAAAGSMLGSGAVIIISEDTSMVEVLANLMHFFAHESCGQCTPCREGTGWLNRIAQRFVQGTAKKADIEKIYRIADNMKDKTICVLSEAAALPAKSIITKFAHEFEARIS